jgi:endoglucanase
VTAVFNKLPPRVIDLTIAGTRSGKVGFSPSGSEGQCFESCTNSFIPGAKVTLTAVTNEGSRFAGWTGACRGTSICSLTLDAAKSVTATFGSTDTVSNVGDSR